MRYRILALLVLTSLPLAACGDGDKPRLLAESTPPPPPELPADIIACPAGRYRGEVRKYPAHEVAVLFERESQKVERVSACLRRLICSTKEYRAKIAQVHSEAVCPPLAGKVK